MKKIVSIVASVLSRSVGILVILLIIITAAAVYSQIRYQDTREELEALRKDPQAKARAETEDLIAKISALTDLPQGEVPMIATVSDASVLQDQSFFKNAQNGDKILVYTESARAVLYRPSTNKVIEVGPVDINKSKLGAATSGVAGDTSVSATTEPTIGNVKVVVYKSTSAEDIDDMVEKLSSVDQVEIVLTGSAAGVYEDSMVVKLRDDVEEGVVAAVMGALGAKEVSLPSGEARPDIEADLLVILGGSKPSSE